jgi:hypothetical protein
MSRFAGPSFYHGHEWPLWFEEERSAMIREGVDIIQEVAFKKLMSLRLEGDHAAQEQERGGERVLIDDRGRFLEPLQTVGGWELLHTEALGGRVSRPPGMHRLDECVLTQD